MRSVIRGDDVDVVRHPIPAACFESTVDEAFVPDRLANMAGNRGGSIINISSGAGLVGQSWAAAYNASKAAVHLLAKSTAIQYARDGIRANSVHPGAIDTRMLAGSSDLIGDSEAFNRPMGRMGAPEEIAYGVVFLASDESSFMTGTELVIDGGKLSGQWRLADTPYGMQG